MGALPRYAPFVKHDDVVGIADGGNTLRHDDDRPSPQLLLQGSTQCGVGLVVQGAEAVIEQEGLGIASERTGDGQTLALAARYVGAALGNGSVHARFLGLDEILRLGDFGRLHQTVGTGVGIAVGKVARDSAGKQEGLLRHITQKRMEALLGKVAHVHAIDGHLAARHVIGAHEQAQHSRFARARSADDGRGLARLRGEAHIFEHLLGRIGVGEINLVEDDFHALTLAGFRVGGLDGIGDAALGCQYLVDALCGNLGARQEHRDHGHHEEAHDDEHGVGDEGDHVAGLDGAVVDIARGDPHDQHRNAVHDQHHAREHERHHPVREQLGALELQARFVEALFFVLLAVEGPDDRQAGQHLAGNQIHPVDQSLHDLELGQGQHHEQHDQAHHQGNG